MKTNLKKWSACLLVLATVIFSHATVDALVDPFQNPPEATKPWCYWYWLDGDVTEEGITKDLEQMVEVGIARAMIGNINGGGPVKMFSPEWYALTRHAFSEAARVGVELYMFNAPGWSQSGGPWITPEQSMRRVIWNEVSAVGGEFSQKIRAAGVPQGQDIAVMAVPRVAAVTIVGKDVLAALPKGEELSLVNASWIWYPEGEKGVNKPAGTRYFKQTVQVDTADLEAADIMLTADNEYMLYINGKEILKDGKWNTQETVSIKPYLTRGENVISIAAKNSGAGAAGLIAAVRLVNREGNALFINTDATWLASEHTDKGWRSPEILGAMSMGPWKLKSPEPGLSRGVLEFTHTQPFTARALVVHGKADGKLYAVQNGERTFVADINANGGSAQTDFLPEGIETFSFKDITAQKFELVPGTAYKVELTSLPMVAQVIEKQMGRMHPTPAPTWESYIYPDTFEPTDGTKITQTRDMINLSDKLDENGVLTCTLPPGEWTLLYFGMITTGKKNSPAPKEATGLEVDKMSREHIKSHFYGMFTQLLEQMSPEERAAFTGITIDSYEVGAQNWTDHFAEEFEKRNGYSPIAFLPVLTGRTIGSAKTSDQFLWDLRRTIADMISEYYVGGLRDLAHQHNLTVWCENYGHWGFAGDFLSYGGNTDEIGGEFWANSNRGNIECRAASSSGHIYGKRRIYAEAYTDHIRLDTHPYKLKARGDQLFCEGINHFVLHVYAHQPREGVPGKNPAFGTQFHRNTPWLKEARDWVKHLQRCHLMLQQGKPVADVAVYIGDFAPQMTGPANPVPEGYDYDYIGSDAILKNLGVKDGQWVVYDEHNPERIAGRYSLLAMPDVKYIRPQVLAKFEELKKKGGKMVDGVPVTVATLQDAGITPLVSDSSGPIRWKARAIDDGMIFFLSNFSRTGAFETTLRVTDKVPELFNPASGEITKFARYESVKSGTRITINVQDRSDSFFIVFREATTKPSVVGVQLNGKAVSAADLLLFYTQEGKLTAQTAKAGTYTLTMSDGTTKRIVVEQNSESFAIEGRWKTKTKDTQRFSVLHEKTFNLPRDFGKDQRVFLDLGNVEVMAKVTLNGNVFDTLWMPPFQLDVTDELKSGSNDLQVLVTSTSEGKPKLGDVIQLKTLMRKTVD